MNAESVCQSCLWDAISLPLSTLKSKTNVRHQMCAVPSSLAFGLVRLGRIFKSCLSYPSDLCNVQVDKKRLTAPENDARLDALHCDRLKKKQQQQGNSDNRRNKWQIVFYESYEITISVEMFVSVSVLQHICFFHVLSCTWWMFVLTYSSGFDNVQ